MPSRRAVLRLAVFFAFLILVFVGVDAVITAGLGRLETGGYGVTNRIVSGRVNAEIVISGSSRALSHYDPRIIQSVTGRTAFNIGRNGSQTDMQVAVLKTYLKHNAKPQLVIHNLDLFSFRTSHEVYDPGQYLPYLDEEAIYAALRKIDSEVWKWRWLPLYGYAVQDMRFSWLQGLKAWTGTGGAEDHFLGFKPGYQSWTGDFDAYRAAHPGGVSVEIEAKGVRDLEEIGSLCKDAGIPLLFVYSPEYHEMQDLERNRTEIFAAFHAMAGRFQVPIWDFSDSSICRDRRFFYNSQHLNADGAALFSEALSRRLKSETISVAKQTNDP